MMVTVDVPVVAELVAVSVSVDDVPVAADGLKDAVTPVGNPLAASVTVPEKPPVRVMVTVAF